MPSYSSPQAGAIDAPDIITAARWLMHRHAHALYGERAIVRSLIAGGLGSAGEGITARAWVGAPRPGNGRLDETAIEIYFAIDYQPPPEAPQ